tara:strand:+ start:824 stop:940 length:117 start_codon:yes stop_codon:yes gene_type:complete
METLAFILLHALAIGACFYIGYTFGKQESKNTEHEKIR